MICAIPCSNDDTYAMPTSMLCCDIVPINRVMLGLIFSLPRQPVGPAMRGQCKAPICIHELVWVLGAPAHFPPPHPHSTGPLPNQPLCNVRRGRYRYTDNLLALEARRPGLNYPPLLRNVVTPLRVEVWEDHLTSHPDPTFVGYLLRRLRDRFRIGPQGQGGGRQTKRNLRSAYEHAEVVPCSGSSAGPHSMLIPISCS